MNKGRDYHRAEQAHYRRLASRVYYPRQIDSSKNVFALSGRQYQKTKVMNKSFEFIGADGKDHSIPYQTCTYVRVERKAE